jgi:divalent metal cation (Fe/Co/Zn/Cd) transporter
MYKKVLVTLDESKLSEVVLPHLQKLVEGCPADITLPAVSLGALGVWLGYSWADPIVGLLIATAILGIVWQSGAVVFPRLLNGVDPEVVEGIRHAATATPGVREVTQARVRWISHQLHAEGNAAVSPELSVEKAHAIAKEIRHELLHCLPHLSNATIHIDPATMSGEEHH